MSAGPLLSHPSLAGDLDRVEGALRDAVRTDDPFLTEIASHLITAGGKRVRPLFGVVCSAVDQPLLLPATDAAVQGGVSVELVHLGSLYHDDVMDEAVTRRGAESVNHRWGNLVAILAGDFLLAKASEIAASLGTEVAGLLAATIGRLCEGQVLELQTIFDPTRTEERYLTSIGGKTASLFASACRIGGIVGGLDRDAIDAVTVFGERYGMAFQIVDDVLDVVATDEQLGKPAGNDLVEGVYTLPVIRALASPVGPELSELLGRPLGADDRDRARALVRADGSVDAALATARGYVDGAREAITPFDTEASTTLAAAADALLASVEAIAATH